MEQRFANLLSLLKPKRRWAQFSLGTMLLGVTLLCVWLADYVSPVRKLERQLSDLDEEVREHAAERLGYMGSEARSTTKALLSRANNDTSSPVRVKSLWALSRVSGRADLLSPLLTDNDEDVTVAAVEGMLWLGDDPAKVLPALLKQAGDQDVESILEGMSPGQAAAVIPLMLDALWTGEKTEQNNLAVPAFEAMSPVALPADTVVPALVQRLNHNEPRMRTAAAEQLLRLGMSAKQAVPALRARLNDPDEICAVACAAALCAIDPSDAESVGVLNRAIRSGDMRLNYYVAKYLWSLGQKDDALLDDLIEFVCDSHRSGPWPSFAASTLVRLGPPAVDALTRALNDAMSERDRLPLSAEGLRERIANVAWTSLPVVRRLLESARGAPNADEDEQDAAGDGLRPSDQTAAVRFLEQAEVKIAAAAQQNRHWPIPVYLGMFGRDARSAVPTLIRALDYADFRHYSILALANMGPDAAPAVPRLVRFLESEDDMVQSAALHVLAKIGVSDEAVRAKLRPILASGDRYERADAARLMAGFGEPVDQILPTLIELAIDPHFSRGGEGLPTGESYSPGAREELIDSMALFGDAALPRLIAALRDKNPRVRRVSADALGEIGPAASEAVPQLIALLDDEQVWDAAAEALGQIGPESRAAVPKLVEALEAMRKPPDPSDYDPDEYEYDADEYDWSGYDPNEYYPRLDALAGIGEESLRAVPEVLRIANFDDRAIRQAAVLTLARIAPRNPSLIPHIRRLLVEWERKSATEDLHSSWIRGDPVEKLAEAIWQLGRHGEPLARDLERIVTAQHLVNWKVRCHAAFALASFPLHRQTAETYLESVVASGFPSTSQSINLVRAFAENQRRAEEPNTAGRRIVGWPLSDPDILRLGESR